MDKDNYWSPDKIAEREEDERIAFSEKFDEFFLIAGSAFFYSLIIWLISVGAILYAFTFILSVQFNWYFVFIVAAVFSFLSTIFITLRHYLG